VLQQINRYLNRRIALRSQTADKTARKEEGGKTALGDRRGSRFWTPEKKGGGDKRQIVKKEPLRGEDLTGFFSIEGETARVRRQATIRPERDRKCQGWKGKQTDGNNPAQ